MIAYLLMNVKEGIIAQHALMFNHFDGVKQRLIIPIICVLSVH